MPSVYACTMYALCMHGIIKFYDLSIQDYAARVHEALKTDALDEMLQVEFVRKYMCVVYRDILLW